jgi:DNA-binding NarL/FixJ family response regulator
MLRVGPRQRQVLTLVAKGKKDAAIALELGLSVSTVRTYLTRLYRDNGLTNRAEAVAAWMGAEQIVAEK